MSTSTSHQLDTDGWWSRLGLRPDFGTFHGIEGQVLRKVRPTRFACSDCTDEESQLTFDEVVRLLKGAREVAEQQHELHRRERRASAEADFESAFTRPDADVRIEQGQWSGFTHGEAAAWSWNLFQFETRGIAHPGSQLRFESIAKLRAGEFPGVFGYSERARELTNRGLTPREYRHLQEKLKQGGSEPDTLT